jgi:hypothetical protein
MVEERRARVLGLGCSNSDGVSSYGTRTIRGNILLTFGSGDGRGWSGNAAQWRQNCASVSGFTGGSPSMVRVGLAPEWLGDASRSDSEAQNGLACGGSWGRLAAPARFGQSIRAGGAPIYRGNPSTHSRRGDDIDSISNLKQMRRRHAWLSGAAGRFVRGEGRPGSAGPRWAAPEWERETAGWARLGFQLGFSPQPKIELKIPFLFSKSIYNFAN